MPNKSSNGVKWTIGILVTICMAAVIAVGSLSIAGDAKLDDEKLDKEVYKTQKKADEKIQDIRDKRLEKMDGKLDKLLEK